MKNGEPLPKLDLTGGALPAVPGIAAAFLVKFDHRKGYVPVPLWFCVVNWVSAMY